MQTMTESETEAVLRLLSFIDVECAELPVRAVAGAMLRCAVALAVETYGDEIGEAKTRQALDAIFAHRLPRTVQ